MAALLRQGARRVGGSVLHRTQAAVTSPAVAEERRRILVPRRMYFTQKAATMAALLRQGARRVGGSVLQRAQAAVASPAAAEGRRRLLVPRRMYTTEEVQRTQAASTTPAAAGGRRLLTTKVEGMHAAFTTPAAAGGRRLLSTERPLYKSHLIEQDALKKRALKNIRNMEIKRLTRIRLLLRGELPPAEPSTAVKLERAAARRTSFRIRCSAYAIVFVCVICPVGLIKLAKNRSKA